MPSVMETLPCAGCGAETYSNNEEREAMLYCMESEKPVLTCDAVPRWAQDQMAEANRVQAEAAYDKGEDEAPDEDEARNLAADSSDSK